ncbi:putative exported protein [Halobacteriovorax marinus SJ]|uniref:Exported protein n=1 Tax=Halobacteriovorax marinus (strain ATCC BAA-682 / DSM 15412 / SJ) TaxID=862908 RepID=E1X055_HALMS|nr:hypothetical protein [Halobacteriovorax marinus]CBW26282.1 putative exported protein [Halobacteriovorax marinus SJ]
MKKSVVLLVALATLSNAYSSEIDPFNNRTKSLEDSLAPINAKANLMMKDALAKLNKKNHSCSEKKLYKALRKKFRNQYTSEFSKWVVKTDELDKVTTRTSDSIYQEFKWFQAIVPGLFAKISDPAGQIMKVAGVHIGTDKFEHFMGSGYNYFKKYYLKNGSLEDAMDIGYRAETGILGATMTGVMSYADMVANFNGMRFWNTMLGKNPDVLTQEEVEPYIVCEKEKWHKVRDIDFSDYIDSAWDEGINCSWFRTESMVEKVKERMAQYDEERGFAIGCPIDSEALNEAGEKYKDLPIQIINYEGHQALKSHQD